MAVGVSDLDPDALGTNIPQHKPTPNYTFTAELRCSTAQTAYPLRPGCREKPAGGSNRPSAIQSQGGVTLPPPPIDVHNVKTTPILHGGAPRRGLGLAPVSATLSTAFPCPLLCVPYLAATNLSPKLEFQAQPAAAGH